MTTNEGRKEESCGVIPVLRSTGEVLLVQSRAGYWGFPKGHKEPHDANDIATALRELREETGVTDCDLNPELVYEIRYTIEIDGVASPKIVRLYIGIVTDPALNPTPGEAKDAKWFDYDTAMATLSFDDLREVLRDAYLQVRP